jgi:hypothetical protein
MTAGVRLPASARAISRATIDAVDAAAAQAAQEFEEATNRLAGAEPEQVRVVLGVVVRAMLEDLHPDGLAGDDLLQLIRDCARASIGWYPQLDVTALVVVLTGALGLHEPEEEPRKFTPLDVARHAPLFIRELLATDRTPKTLGEYFQAAFTQIAQSELTELP